jgi:uncharacterized repeat protein (TIGR03803 family)
MPSYLFRIHPRAARRSAVSIQPKVPVRRSVPEISVLEARRLFSGGYTYEQLASFSAAGTTGSAPGGQIAVNKSGDLFGFTSTGGANGTGAAYEVQQRNSTPILLASFPAASGGTSFVATGPAIDASGDLFGVTEGGGDANQDGTVFEIVAGSGVVTTLATFNSVTTGSSPGGNLIIDSAGDLFGTTANGGANNCGTVWELPKGATAVVALASFTPVNVNGVNQNPGANGIAMDGSGNLFGTTGGNAAVGSDGTVWELPRGTSSIQTLVIFNGSNGITPVGGVAIDGSGNVFGVTQYGGDDIGTTADPQGSGVVWELPAGTGQLAVLANFDSASSGEFPLGGVVLDSKGDLFGTTSSDGNASASSAGDGTVWEIPAQSVTINSIAFFTGANGATPQGKLVTDTLGNIYGTASAGGTDGGGAVFEMDFGGASTSAAALSPTVVKSTLPANIAAGAKALGTVTIDLQNTSSTAVRGAFTIAAYASDDGVIDSASTKIGSITRTVQVPRNGTTAVTLAVPSFQTNAQGTYTLLAQVTDGAGNVSNAVRGVSIVVAPAVISLSEVFAHSTLASALVSGEKVRAAVTLRITNSGNVVSSGVVQIALGLSSAAGGGALTTIASVTPRLAIPAGRSVVMAVPVTSIPAGLDGTYSLMAQLTDPVGGSSSASSSSTFTVSPPTVTLRATINAFTPTQLAADSNAHGTISLTITNDGNIPVGAISDSRPFAITVGLASQDGTQTASLGSFTRTIVVNPGQSRKLTLPFSSTALTSLTAGSYFPTVAVTVAETSYSTTATGSKPITVT